MSVRSVVQLVRLVGYLLVSAGLVAGLGWWGFIATIGIGVISGTHLSIDDR